MSDQSGGVELLQHGSGTLHAPPFADLRSVCVLSPHLDDGVLSLGASISSLVRRSIRVSILTVFAGVPGTGTDLAPEDKRAGFTSSASAATARRQEDLNACELLGCSPIWLDFQGGPTRTASIDDVVHALEPFMDTADLLLVPGFPLLHPDHRLVAAAADQLRHRTTIACYAEQPYAAWKALSRTSFRRDQAQQEGPPRTGCSGRSWQGVTLKDYITKLRAVSQYRSQLAVLRRFPRARIMAYEATHGGESIFLPDLSRRSRDEKGSAAC